MFFLFDWVIYRVIATAKVAKVTTNARLVLKNVANR